MYKKFLMSAAILAAAMYATSAGAITVITQVALVPPDTGNGGTIGAIPTQVTFDEIGVNAAAPGSVTPNVPAVINGASFSGGGIIMNNPGGPVAGMYAPPIVSNGIVGTPDATNYLAVVPQPSPGGAGTLTSPETITLPGNFLRFGLLWGSVDSYNTITLTDGTVANTFSLTGTGVINPANGNQGIGGTFYVLFTSDTAFNTVILSSTQNSFEVDNLFWGSARDTSPTPLPGALPLFASGLGGLGFLRFWRKKKQPIKMAAA